MYLSIEKLIILMQMLKLWRMLLLLVQYSYYRLGRLICILNEHRKFFVRNYVEMVEIYCIYETFY